MKAFLFLLLLVTSVLGAESRGPFYDPVTGFSDALIPILTSFEKAKIETTLRGFIARADSFPGFEKSDMEPSEHGLYLNVSVRDASEISGLSDRKEQTGAGTRRLVQIPPPKTGDQALVILLDYGRDVAPEVIRTMDMCIRRVIEFSKEQSKP